MARKLKASSGKKRGRPAVVKPKGETILSNGLLQRQWDRIKKDSGSSSTASVKLREIVDWYYTQVDAEKRLDEVNAKLQDAAVADKLTLEKSQK